SEGERRQRWGGGGGRPERQINLEIAARYLGQGREQSRFAGAGGRNAKRESIAWTFAGTSQQHGAGSKRRFYQGFGNRRGGIQSGGAGPEAESLARVFAPDFV